jgi:hypothetical protein
MAEMFRERRTKMRWPKIGFFLLTAVSLSALPLPASALRIQFCIPACEGPEADPQPKVFGPGNPLPDDNGVVTNSVSLGTFGHSRDSKAFTITATVTSQQSASLQKITFNPTSITADLGSTCSTADPCRIEIIATSDQFDFPALKPVGGYPAGAYMTGSFTGPQAASPNGDTISATSEASGIRLVSTDSTGSEVAEPVTTDVINTAPGTDPGNVGASLPSACTGNPGCKFIASSLRKAFSTQLSETVQQQCASEETSCLTRLRTRLNIALKTAGNRVNLPYDWATANEDPEKPAVNPTEEMVAATVASAANFDVNSLAVGPNHFLMRATLILGADGSFDPVGQEVYASVGPFSLTILPNQFKRLQEGRVFLFNGKVDERQVNATFARDRRNPLVWDVIFSVFGIALTNLPEPPLQVPVEIGVGNDLGRDLVTARFFGTPAK